MVKKGMIYKARYSSRNVKYSLSPIINDKIFSNNDSVNNVICISNKTHGDRPKLFDTNKELDMYAFQEMELY